MIRGPDTLCLSISYPSRTILSRTCGHHTTSRDRAFRKQGLAHPERLPTPEPGFPCVLEDASQISQSLALTLTHTRPHKRKQAIRKSS